MLEPQFYQTLSVEEIIHFLKIADEFIDLKVENVYRQDSEDPLLIKWVFDYMRKGDESSIRDLLSSESEEERAYKTQVLACYIRRILSNSEILAQGDFDIYVCQSILVNKMQMALQKAKNDPNKIFWGPLIEAYFKMMSTLITLGFSHYVHISHQCIYMMKKYLVAQQQCEGLASGMLLGGVLLRWLQLSNKLFVETPAGTCLAKEFQLMRILSSQLIADRLFDLPFDEKINEQYQYHQQTEEEFGEMKKRLLAHCWGSGPPRQPTPRMVIPPISLPCPQRRQSQPLPSGVIEPGSMEVLRSKSSPHPGGLTPRFQLELGKVFKKRREAHPLPPPKSTGAASSSSSSPPVSSSSGPPNPPLLSRALLGRPKK